MIFEIMAGVDWVAHREYHPNEVFGEDFSAEACVRTIQDWQSEAMGAGASLWCTYDIDNGTYGVPCVGEDCPAFTASLAIFML